MDPTEIRHVYLFKKPPSPALYSSCPSSSSQISNNILNNTNSATLWVAGTDSEPWLGLPNLPLPVTDSTCSSSTTMTSELRRCPPVLLANSQTLGSRRRRPGAPPVPSTTSSRAVSFFLINIFRFYLSRLDYRSGTEVWPNFEGIKKLKFWILDEFCMWMLRIVS